MTVWSLTTNEGTYIVHCKPTQEQSMRYIRAKMAQGYKLSEVMFCWGPIVVHHNVNWMVAQQERDCAAQCIKCRRAMLNGKCNQTTGECING